MRDIIINRPKRMECCAVTLKIEINGVNVAKIKNNQEQVVQAEIGPVKLRVHGGWPQGKGFQDTVIIPAGSESYRFQVDFVSAQRTNYLPVLRPCGDATEKADNRVTTIMGASLCKLLLQENLLNGLRSLPGASVKVMMLPDEWRVLLWHEGGGKILMRSEYYQHTDGLANLLITGIERQQLATQEGREAMLEKVMTGYVSHLPQYERQGKYGIVLRK